jgi:hypothetical protein
MFDPYHKWLGIRSERKPPNHYQLLGISTVETDLEVIEEAFIRQTTHLRSYQNGPHALVCTQVLNELAKAHVTLMNPAKRKEYDAELEEERAYQMRAKIKPFSAPLASDQTSAPVAAPPPKVSKPKRQKQSEVQYESYRGTSKTPIIPIVAGAVALAVIVVVVIVLINNSGGPTSSTDQAHRGDRAKDTLPPRKPPEPDPQPPIDPQPNEPPPQINRPREDSPPPRRPVEEEPKPREQPPAPPVKRDDPPPPAAEPEKPDNKEQPPDLSKVDLLKLVSPPRSRDVVKGKWNMSGKTLVSPLDPEARIQIPYLPPEEYDLRIVAERKQGPDCVCVGFPVPGLRTFMNIDAGNNIGYVSGLQGIDAVPMMARRDGSFYGPLMVKGRKNTIEIKVRRQSITIIVNNRTIVNYTGDFRRLQCGDGWEAPLQGAFIIGTWKSSYHFSAIELTPVSGPGKVVD